jgi:hypothetical protein
MSEAINSVILERQRQINEEGWTPGHDDSHTAGELARAAAAYAWFASFSDDARAEMKMEPKRGYINILWWMWPKSWSERWWKPKDRRRDLVRAAALLIAEIERLDRREKS